MRKIIIFIFISIYPILFIFSQDRPKTKCQYYKKIDPFELKGINEVDVSTFRRLIRDNKKRVVNCPVKISYDNKENKITSIQFGKSKHKAYLVESLKDGRLVSFSNEKQTFEIYPGVEYKDSTIHEKDSLIRYFLAVDKLRTISYRVTLTKSAQNAYVYKIDVIHPNSKINNKDWQETQIIIVEWINDLLIRETCLWHTGKREVIAYKSSKHTNPNLIPYEFGTKLSFPDFFWGAW